MRVFEATGIVTDPAMAANVFPHTGKRRNGRISWKTRALKAEERIKRLTIAVYFNGFICAVCGIILGKLLP